MNLLGLSLASVGNHEFDKGSGRAAADAERRLRQDTRARVPCRLEPFAGARFQYLAANVVRQRRNDHLPGDRDPPGRADQDRFHRRDAEGNRDTVVSPGGVAGLHFTDEAATANALVPQLKARARTRSCSSSTRAARCPDTYEEQGCNGFAGDILPILDKLDPAITTVISGHTHNAYACTLAARRRRRGF